MASKTMPCHPAEGGGSPGLVRMAAPSWVREWLPAGVSGQLREGYGPECKPSGRGSLFGYKGNSGQILAVVHNLSLYGDKQCEIFPERWKEIFYQVGFGI